jgi:PAS domain-containing protein
MSGLVDQLQARIEELELRLRESEERHRQVTDTIDEVFWMTDPHKNSMLFISSAYERIWGRSCQSVLDDPSPLSPGRWKAHTIWNIESRGRMAAYAGFTIERFR